MGERERDRETDAVHAVKAAVFAILLDVRECILLHSRPLCARLSILVLFVLRLELVSFQGVDDPKIRAP